MLNNYVLINNLLDSQLRAKGSCRLKICVFHSTYSKYESTIEVNLRPRKTEKVFLIEFSSSIHRLLLLLLLLLCYMVLFPVIFSYL